MQKQALAASLSALLLEGCASAPPPAEIKNLEPRETDFYANVGLEVNEKTCAVAESRPVTAVIEDIAGTQKSVTACLHDTLRDIEALQSGCRDIARLNLSEGSFSVGVSDQFVSNADQISLPDIHPRRFVCVAKPQRQETFQTQAFTGECHGEVLLLRVKQKETGISIPLIACDDRIQIQNGRTQFACPDLEGYERKNDADWAIAMKNRNYPGMPFIVNCDSN